MPATVVHRFEQPGEVAGRIVGRLVVVHDLAEELHLPAPASAASPHLGQDLGLRPHALVAARVRHHAEAAVLVAAFDDRHPRADRIAAARQAERKRDVVVRAEVDLRRGASRRPARPASAASATRRVPTTTSTMRGALEQRLALPAARRSRRRRRSGRGRSPRRARAARRAACTASPRRARARCTC